MSFNYLSAFKKKEWRKTISNRKLISLTVLFMFIFSSIFINITYNNTPNNNAHQNINGIEDKEQINPEIATNISMLQDPFTKHFDDMKQALEILLDQFNETFFMRLANDEGNVIDDTIFSEDHFRFYNSLDKLDITSFDTFLVYLAARLSPLWYEGNLTENEYAYGFIESINGTTGEIINSNRTLIANLMPIFLLCENYDTNSKTEIQKLFWLLNSTEFWNETTKGFLEYNSSSRFKYAYSNFYAVLANFLIHRTEALDSIKGRAYDLALENMNALLENMWDEPVNLGFSAWTKNDWSSGGPYSMYKHLDVNALGILALLDTWIATGMESNSSYLANATILYNKINENLWNNTYNAYEYRRQQDWSPTSISEDSRLDLAANSLMMRACLKFYDLTGNLSYYNKAIELFNFLENYLFNDTINLYMSSIGYGNNTNIDLKANMMLCKALIEALEIYESTTLRATYSGGANTPNYILDQDVLNLTCTYSIEKTNYYWENRDSDPIPFQITYNITNANITYIMRYSNQTIFETFEDYIKPNVTVGTISEQTRITCTADENSDLNGTYFNISTPSANYYVWYDVNDSGAAGLDPNPGGTGIKVSTIITNDSSSIIANETKNALEAYLGGDIFSVSRSTSKITITNKEKGITANATDGIGQYATNFTIEILREGVTEPYYSHTLLYNITEDMPIGDDYSITIFANISNFGFASSLKSFNIIPGLSNGLLEGLEDINYLYQGQTVNISLPITSKRNENCTFNVTLEAEGLEAIPTKEVNLTVETGENNITNILFNITAKIAATAGIHDLIFSFKRGDILYLEVTEFTIIIANALDFNNLIYNKRVVSGNNIDVSLNIINFLPNNSQDCNISFTGDYIKNIKSPVSLIKKEIKTVSYSLEVSREIVESTIEIEMVLSKNKTDIHTDILSVNIVPKFEVINIHFSEIVTQGGIAYFIIIIQNNQENSKEFSLYLNGKEIEANIDTLIPGENRIIKEVQTPFNPYKFGTENYQFSLEDNTGELIFKQNFEVEFELSSFNLILFYIIPILVPIGIILFYKNKDIKNKLLRR